MSSTQVRQIQQEILILAFPDTVVAHDEYGVGRWNLALLSNEHHALKCLRHTLADAGRVVLQALVQNVKVTCPALEQLESTQHTIGTIHEKHNILAARATHCPCSVDLEAGAYQVLPAVNVPGTCLTRTQNSAPQKDIQVYGKLHRRHCSKSRMRWQSKLCLVHAVQQEDDYPAGRLPRTAFQGPLNTPITVLAVQVLPVGAHSAKFLFQANAALRDLLGELPAELAPRKPASI